MEERHSDQIEQLKATINALSAQIDELTSRVQSLEQQDPLPKPTQHTPSFAAKLATPSSNRPAPSKRPTDTPAYLSKPKTRPTAPRVRQLKKTKAQSQGFDFKKLEWFLGVRGLAVLGMLIVVISVGSFLKLAIDEGWIAAIPPATRCGGSALFGVLLIAIGEFFRRKINPLASSGVSAAGIAVVYAAILAATKMYDLLGTPVAFTLLALITLIGILLGSLSNRVMLAMLSLIGSFAVPVLLSTGEPSFVVLPVYLISLLILGLGLSGWRGGSYSRVRQLAWWGTGLIGSFWLKDMYAIGPTSSIAFVSGVWIVTVAELIASSRFFTTIRDKTNWPDSSHAGFLLTESGERTFDLRTFLTPEARWINALFGVTAWSVTATAMTIRQINPEYDFFAPLSFALLSTVMLHLVFGWKKIARELWSESASPRSILASAMVVNAALLGAATIATALGGWIQVVAWVAVGLTAIETSTRIRFRAAGLFGFALIAVAIGRLLTHDFIAHLQSDPTTTLFELGFTQWTPQVALVAIVCVLASWRSKYTPEGWFSASAALWLVAICLLHTSTQPHALGAAVLLIAAIGAWVSVYTPTPNLRLNAFLLAGAGMLIVLWGQAVYDIDHDQVMAIDIHPASMLIAGIAWIALAALPKSRYATRLGSAAFAITSGSIAIAKLTETHGESEAIFALSIYAILITVLATRLFRWSLIEITSVLLFVITGAWVLHQLSLGDPTFQIQPVLNFGFPATIILAALAIWIGLRLPSFPASDDAPSELADSRKTLRVAVFVLAWGLLLSSTSLEVVRTMRGFADQGSAGGAAVSIWWSLFAIASVVIGFKLTAALRWAGLALLGIVAIKVLLVDTVTLDQGARIIASITVGLVIIAAGVLYAKLVDVVIEKDQDSKADTESENHDEPTAE